MSIFGAKLTPEQIAANKRVYIATLKHLFNERGRSMHFIAELKREVDGRVDHQSRSMYLLNENGLELAHYDYDEMKWIRAPKNEQYKLLTNCYIDPDYKLEELANSLLLQYMIGNISLSEVSYKTSYILKD